MRGEKAVPIPGEEEAGMYKEPIEVVTVPTQKLSEASRIDFGTVNTIQYNWPVCNVGRVSENSQAKLMTYWQNTQNGPSSYDYPSTPQPSVTRTRTYNTTGFQNSSTFPNSYS